MLEGELALGDDVLKGFVKSLEANPRLIWSTIVKDPSDWFWFERNQRIPHN